MIHLVDAFTNRPFSGNPAAVCLLETPADGHWMQLVAREINLSETAFLHRIEAGWSLRWFTPTLEVKLCGHATLAAAFTLWETGVLPENEPARFLTLSGWLVCRCDGDWVEMDFPASVPTMAPNFVVPGISEALGCELLGVGQTGVDYLVEVADETALRALTPDFSALGRLPVRGVIVTSRSDATEFDFVSRFFAPAVGINEDPVTGSAHCALGPHWQSKLGKSDFIAYQASPRGGVVKVAVRGDRVLLQGQAVMMAKLELAH